jgi:tripartite-type tricarboxylate transporter receptor subunit TctC
MKTIGSIAVAALALMTAVAAPAQAQTYPDRPVRIVLPFGAGGVADITARIVADALGTKLGQRFIVENAPGAGGIAAARAVLSSPADGYTLAMLTNGTAISVPLFKSLPFNPVTDFMPISSLGYFDFVIGTNPESGLKTLGDAIKLAKEKPDALNAGTINIGSSQNLSAELLKTSANIKFTVIPYRGTPEVIVGVLRNDVQIMIDSYSAMKSNILDKKIIPLATTGKTRSQSLPDVPTVEQGGVPGYEVLSWNALFAPKGTPQPVIDALNKTLQTVMADPEIKKKLLELGIEAKASTPAEISARLNDDIKKWGAVIETANIPKQ